MTHYKRGYCAERLAKKELERQGYHVTRAGGSKQIDLIALALKTPNYGYEYYKIRSSEEPIIRAIMVTRNRTKGKRNKDYDFIKNLPLPAIVSKELWVYTPRKPFEIEIVNEEDK